MHKDNFIAENTRGHNVVTEMDYFLNPASWNLRLLPGEECGNSRQALAEAESRRRDAAREVALFGSLRLLPEGLHCAAVIDTLCQMCGPS
jgi:hypothetical protein